MGGAAAPRTPAEGAASIAAVILRDGAEVGTGRFFDEHGRECAW
jgi:hypothetical protein